MAGSIYLIQSTGELLEMKETSYPSEELLQKLLAKYPNLLAGDQIDSLAPRRWLLISREFSLASDYNEAPRWSIDHLFLDQDGIPTIVETKRSDDTRIRREVAGQMLEYAANGVVYWPIETIISEFESRCEKEGHDPDALLKDLLQGEMEIDAFWAQVKTNLQAGKIRLVWVSDSLPKELRRIIEFLNEQMDPAQAIGIEIKMFSDQNLKVMVPRVINPPTQRRVASSPGKQWTEEEFFSVLTANKGANIANIAKSILDWARSKSLKIWWGRGRIEGSFIPGIKVNSEEYYPITVNTKGNIGIQFGVLKTRSAFKDEAKRKELLDRLNRVYGISLPNDAIERYPSFPATLLLDEGSFKQFISILDWIVEIINKQKS
jgi:hypothetical protein